MLVPVAAEHRREDTAVVVVVMVVVVVVVVVVIAVIPPPGMIHSPATLVEMDKTMGVEAKDGQIIYTCSWLMQSSLMLLCPRIPCTQALKASSRRSWT